MAKNQTVRLSPAKLQADVDALTALQGVSGYTPANESYTLSNVQNLFNTMREVQDDEVAKQNALAASRDNATSAEWDFHNAILGVKEQVIAQFGKNSNELQSLGLKKKSEYKAPKRRQTTSA